MWWIITKNLSKGIVPYPTLFSLLKRQVFSNVVSFGNFTDHILSGSTSRVAYCRLWILAGYSHGHHLKEDVLSTAMDNFSVAFFKLFYQKCKFDCFLNFFGLQMLFILYSSAPKKPNQKQKKLYLVKYHQEMYEPIHMPFLLDACENAQQVGKGSPT